MIHLGDITKIDGKRIEPVDVIVGGSPCQDLSVAGKRAGLAGERSGLFMEQIRLTKELRQQDAERGKPAHLCRPRYFVWENVPGAFSSKKGEDFAAVLEEVIRVIEPEAPSVSVPEKGWPTAGCIYDDMGRWSVAWRVHDAQFWGVPQRRRRIALVADFGGLSAPEVLFERKGLRGDPAQSGEAREGTAADAERSSGGAISFQERGGKPGGGKGILIQNERTGALSTLNNQSVFNIGSYNSNAWKSENPHSGVYETEVSKTLDALNCGYPACNQGGTAVVCMATQQGGTEVRADDRAGESAGAGGDGQLDAVSGGFCNESAKARSIGWGEELAPTLTAGAVPGVVSAVTIEPGIAAREGGHIYEGVCGTLRAEAGDNRMAVAYTLKIRSGCDGDGCNPQYGDPCHPLADGAHPPAAIICGNPWDTQSERVYMGDGAWHSLNSNSSGGQSRDAIFCLQGNGIDRADTAGCNGKGWREDVCYTLNTIDRPAVYDARGNGDGETVCTITGDHENRVTDYTAILTMQGFGDYKESGIASACKSRDYKDATDLVVSGIDARNGAENGDLCGTLQAKPNGGFSYNCIHPVRINKSVRRLTPLECERLQGYPDGWTDIGEWVDSKGKRHDSSDSARYKALGNSIALPFWHWLMHRISAQYVGTPTLGSLFDGISGFCLSWARCNGAKNCRWSSEIEEFPMAVTRKHFGDEKTGEVGDIEKYL